MIRTVASKVAWVGRTASMVFGLALVLALLFGVASMAFARDGQSFLLGARNVASSVSTLVKRGLVIIHQAALRNGLSPRFTSKLRS